MEERFEIDAKIIHGISVAGFIIKSVDGKKQKLSTDDVIKLARSGKINKAKALLNTVTGKYVIKIDGGLSSIPSIRNTGNQTLVIEERIVDDNNNCIGYKIKDNNGKISRVSISKTWKLAESGKIYGIKAIIKNSHKILVSQGDKKLSDIKCVKN